jgi:hypothetical protein
MRERAVLKFFDWALHGGAPIAERLDYMPVPQQIVDALPGQWQTLRDGAGRPLWP